MPNTISGLEAGMEPDELMSTETGSRTTMQSQAGAEHITSSEPSGHVSRLYLGKFTKIPSVLLRDGLPVVSRSDDEGPCSEAQSTGSAALYDLAPSSRRRARIPRGRSWSRLLLRQVRRDMKMPRHRSFASVRTRNAFSRNLAGAAARLASAPYLSVQ